MSRRTPAPNYTNIRIEILDMLVRLCRMDGNLELIGVLGRLKALEVRNASDRTLFISVSYLLALMGDHEAIISLINHQFLDHQVEDLETDETVWASFYRTKPAKLNYAASLMLVNMSEPQRRRLIGDSIRSNSMIDQILGGVENEFY